MYRGIKLTQRALELSSWGYISRFEPKINLRPCSVKVHKLTVTVSIQQTFSEYFSHTRVLARASGQCSLLCKHSTPAELTSVNLRNPAAQESKALGSLEFCPSAVEKETLPVDLHSLFYVGTREELRYYSKGMIIECRLNSKDWLSHQKADRCLLGQGAHYYHLLPWAFGAGA